MAEDSGAVVMPRRTVFHVASLLVPAVLFPLIVFASPALYVARNSAGVDSSARYPDPLTSSMPRDLRATTL